MGNMGWKIAEAVLNLAAIGWERDAILAKIKAAQANGMGPGELVKYLRQMRMDSLAQAEAAVAKVEAQIANDDVAMERAGFYGSAEEQPSPGGTD